MPQEKPWRLILRKNGKLRKICGFWGWDKDPTLNIKIYSKKNGELCEIKNIERKEEKVGEKTTISETIKYSDLEKTNFVANKTTFHPSGFTHTTDKKGERFKSGIRSLPFGEIETFRRLAFIFPQSPENYPAIEESKLREHDVIIDLGIFENSPFQIEVFIVRGDKGIYPPRIPNINCADVFCGDKEKLVLFIRCSQIKVAEGKPLFPPATFVAKLIIKNK